MFRPRQDAGVVLRRLERGSAPDALVDALVEAAGIAGGWQVDSVPTSGWVNQTTIVRAGGERLVVRRYGWPFEGEPERFDRRAKEAWLLPRLAAAGVPVPEVVAVADAGDERGMLQTWLPGDLLGVVAAGDRSADLSGAWREAGAALAAAHRVPPPEPVAGFVTAGGVAAFPEGSFGAFHRDRLERYAASVAGAAPELGIDAAEVARLSAAAEPVVDAAGLVLGHGDSNPWNVLVVRGSDGRWVLSGWLDWEFAWVGDPAWDHMRMTGQRFVDIGPTPDAWWEGYGTRPPEANLLVAVLHHRLWKASEHLEGAEGPEIDHVLDHWDAPALVHRLQQLLL